MATKERPSGAIRRGVLEGIVCDHKKKLMRLRARRPSVETDAWIEANEASMAAILARLGLTDRAG
jgi:hypothetical protein